jgi:hypothetical protein
VQGLVLLEKFEGHKEHSEAFPILFSEVFVVYFMGPSDSSGIPVIGIPEHLKTLVDKDIMYQKIRDPVGKYAQAYRPALPEIRIHS